MLLIPNVISFILLLLAIYYARAGRLRAHKRAVFAAMLASFVLVGMFIEMRLQGESLVSKARLASFPLSIKLLLGSHIVAATLTFILSLIVCLLGLREVRKKWHKRIAYFMVPIWTYSVVSGIFMFVLVGQPNDPPLQTMDSEQEVFTAFETSKKLGVFQMDATRGEVFSQADIIGKWTLLFFGYTGCPDVCPMTLTEVTELLNRFKGLQALFITADPQRDELETLKAYVKSFHSAILGLRSAEGGESVLAERLGTSIAREETEAEAYSVFHPTGLYVLSPSGEALGYFRFPLKLDRVINDLERLRESWAPPLSVSRVQVALPPDGADVTAGYLRFFNHGDRPVKVVAISSPDFGKVQIHKSESQGGHMKMAHVDALHLHPGSELDFVPGGHHLMLFSPKSPLTAGRVLRFRVNTESNGNFEFIGRAVERSALLKR